MTSRFRWIAAAIISLLVATGCGPAASPSASQADASATAAPASATAAASEAGKPFEGVEVHLLTFDGPQIAEPLKRRAPDFEALTGARINVDAVGFQEIYDKAIVDLSTGVNSFDAFVFNPQWLGDFVTPGYLEDITDRVNSDTVVQWDDVGPFFRDFNATYGGRVYTIPLDGDFHMVYYRSDLIDSPPTTWEEYLQVASEWHGKDLNDDGEPDYGSCIAKKVGQQSFWWIISVAGGLLQNQGTGEGAFFNTDSMDPLLNNAAFAKALETYKATMQYGPPEEINWGVGDTRGAFTGGRCALTMDWGDVGTLALDPATSIVQDKTGAVITPGWTETLDRATGQLVPCDGTTCPHAVDGVNYAPFASFGGWSGAINAAAASEKKDAAYAFLAYMSAPEQSGEDVTLGKTGFNPYRTSHFENKAPWQAIGMSDAAIDNYLGAIQTSLQSPNMILDLRIPKTKEYEQDVLDKAVSQYIAGELDVQQTMQQITDGWNAITDGQGRDAQLSAYTSSLGIER